MVIQQPVQALLPAVDRARGDDLPRRAVALAHLLAAAVHQQLEERRGVVGDPLVEDRLDQVAVAVVDVHRAGQRCCLDGGVFFSGFW